MFLCLYIFIRSSFCLRSERNSDVFVQRAGLFARLEASSFKFVYNSASKDPPFCFKQTENQACLQTRHCTCTTDTMFKMAVRGILNVLNQSLNNQSQKNGRNRVTWFYGPMDLELSWLIFQARFKRRLILGHKF